MGRAAIIAHSFIIILYARNHPPLHASGSLGKRTHWQEGTWTVCAWPAVFLKYEKGLTAPCAANSYRWKATNVWVVLPKGEFERIFLLISRCPHSPPKPACQLRNYTARACRLHRFFFLGLKWENRDLIRMMLKLLCRFARKKQAKIPILISPKKP